MPLEDGAIAADAGGEAEVVADVVDVGGELRESGAATGAERAAPIACAIKLIISSLGVIFIAAAPRFPRRSVLRGWRRGAEAGYFPLDPPRPSRKT